ncbi:MAG: hypothetical protein HVN35_09130 [Methanobacteriaceae archaeon]|nr:hypothetical protein [Methanobacteriaceae archaeon]
MKGKKLKIRVKTDKFFIPIPALRISTYRWILKQILKYYPSKDKTGTSQDGEYMDTFFRNLSPQDLDLIFDQLESTEPFKMVDIKADDEKDGKVTVEIYTIGG